MNHAIRITQSWVDCSGVVKDWSDRSERCIVYQHDADDEVANTHIHLALYGCEVKAEQLKRMWKECPGKGNGFWSFKDADPFDADYDPNEFGLGIRYLTYMSKGHLEPLFVKNIPNDIVEKSRQAWVKPVERTRPGDHSEYVIKKIMDKFVIDINRGYYRKEDEVIIGQVKMNIDLLWSNVRSESFRQLWGEHRRVPHASHYKIIAATAFLRICEDNNVFSEGSGLVQNLWY